jgi:PadR family transcriptional regulator PadR
MTTLERELKRGTLEMLLLHILDDEPTYGYELLSRLSQRSGGRFHIKEGTLYPVLYRLEDAGLVVPEWDQPARGVARKIYQLTKSGKERVVEMTEAWRSFAAAIEAVLTDAEPEEEKI